MKKTCLVITNGTIGMEKQAIAVAELLDVEITICKVRLKKLWEWFAPYLRIGVRYGLRADSDNLPTTAPDYIVACGRRAIPVALLFKGKSKIIYVQNPRISCRHFDAVVCPEHDGVHGDNVVQVVGSVHNINATKLQAAVTAFPMLTSYPKPIVTVIIGGVSKVYKMSISEQEDILRQLLELAEKYSLLITTSRRTPDFLQKAIVEKLQPLPNVFLYNGRTPNPYHAMLGIADAIVMTPDSVNMISEAVSTDKPVYLLPLKASYDKFAQFYQRLQGRINWLHNDSLTFTVITPFNDIQRIKKELLQIIWRKV